MRKQLIFKVIIEEGGDEYWEMQPGMHVMAADIEQTLVDGLSLYGKVIPVEEVIDWSGTDLETEEDWLDKRNRNVRELDL